MKIIIEFILRNWILIVSTLIATVSVIFNGFLLVNRPYVQAENFFALNKENILVSVPENVVMLVLNVPAKIITVKINYYIVDKEGNKKEIYSEINNNFVRYPGDKIHTSHTSEKIQELLSKNNLKIILYRFIKIDYGWLSHSKKEYYFEGKWKYNSKKNSWDIEYIKAN